MLITPRHKPKPLLGSGTLVDYVEDGDKFITFHAEPVDDLLQSNKEQRKEPARSYGQAKWRKIASIPELLLVQHPEWLHDSSLLEKFLASSDGIPYRTVERI